MKLYFLTLICCLTLSLNAQVVKKFTRADTLRGTLTVERTWWDVQRYELAVAPNFIAKTISGMNSE